jgi:PAS domain S-box-containing protein
MQVLAWIVSLVLCGVVGWLLFRMQAQRNRLQGMQTALKGSTARIQELKEDSLERERRHQSSEDRLRGYLQLLDTLINTIPNPIYFKNPEGVFQGCNRVFARQILGLTRDNIIDRRAQELSEQIPPDLAAIYQRQEGIMFDKGMFHTFESEVQCADGVRREFLFSLAPVSADCDRITGCVAVLADLTEKNRAAQDRLQKEKLQGVLETAGAVCHEFNQPLQAISGYTEIMNAKLADDASRPCLSKIAEQIDRMRDITDRLHGVTRYETMSYANQKKIIDIRKASTDKM